MIHHLQIAGFRGFRHFALENLGRINLLVGTNNSGKTTVLESLQLLCSPGDMYSIYRILSRRGEDWWDAGERGRSVRHVDLRRLFLGHEIRRGSRFDIRSETSEGVHKFSAQIIDAPTPAPTLFENEPPSRPDADDLPSPSALRLTWDERGELDFAITINRRGGLTVDSLRRTVVGAESREATRLITSVSLSAEAIVELFESIVLTREEELVIEALNIIDPSIDRIATSGTDRMRGSDSNRGGVLVRCRGSQHRIPIGSMGDGIWRMLGIALALVRAEGGMLLIDEIDTGLHFSVMANLWRLILETARRLNVQVFATTHSRDCYESLAAICKERALQTSEITLQRIEKDRGVAVAYSEQEILAAARRGMEVR